MDPINSFFARLENEDKIVDHINMKLWGEKLEKANRRVDKLVGCLVEMTGCEKKEAQNYATPGYHPLPENVKLKESQQKMEELNKTINRKEFDLENWKKSCQYHERVSVHLEKTVRNLENWDQEAFNTFIETTKEQIFGDKE